jgi:hypothetical protein
MRAFRTSRAVAFLAIAAALAGLSSCASKPGAPAPGAVKEASPTASPNAAPPAPDSAKATASGEAPSALPEISLPYRRAPRLPLLVASLHEPLPPRPKSTATATEAPVAAAPPSASSQAASVPAPLAEAPKAAVQQGETEKKAAPKAPAPPKAKDLKVSPKAAAKKDVKKAEPEPKNASSTGSLAVVADPASEKNLPVSRNISAVEGTRFELPFEGTGWTYLGDRSNKEGIAYDSRRFDDTSLVFVLNPVKAGDYLLRFQRQDSLRGLSYEELVGVSVAPKLTAKAASSGAASSTGPVAAAVAATPEAAAKGAAVQGAAASTAAVAAAVPTPAAATSVSGIAAPAPSSGAAGDKSATAAPAPAVDPASLKTPEAALALARSELAADRVPGALVALDRLFVLSPEGTDEAAILYARALEKNGPQKDIKRAYSYYKKLRDSYPESSFWDEAAARCSYIERRYFDIR